MNELSKDVFGWLAMHSAPSATATLTGSAAYPTLKGQVWFYDTSGGCLVVAEVAGLPVAETRCSSRIFGFHIHEGKTCTGTAEDPFADTGMHFDKNGCPHPSHTGDLPPLLGTEGFAFSAFYTNRFSSSKIIGRTIVIHEKPDDFTTQPSGNSGKKIACGQIKGS